MEKMKYIKVEDYNSVIIFPQVISHDTFKHLNPISAGFCYISEDKVHCFGESISLRLKSNEYEDSFQATKQYCGVEYLLDFKLLTPNPMKNEIKELKALLPTNPELFQKILDKLNKK